MSKEKIILKKKVVHENLIAYMSYPYRAMYQ